MTEPDKMTDADHHHLRIGIGFEAGWTRLELATSCVTGRRSNQTELPPHSESCLIVDLSGIEPLTF